MFYLANKDKNNNHKDISIIPKSNETAQNRVLLAHNQGGTLFPYLQMEIHQVTLLRITSGEGIS